MTHGYEMENKYLSAEVVEDYFKRMDFEGHVTVAVKKLFDYMKTFWLTRIGASRFSVFVESNRANNSVESWHRSLNRKLIGKHLGIWKFIGS